MARHASDPKERFMKYVTANWKWTGGNDGRYGRFYLHGRLMCAHRAAYELFIGPIPEGLEVLHSCDEPNCVNPEHLHVGTQAQNMAEAVERGRIAHNSGEKQGSTKLSEKDVLFIRESYQNGSLSRKELRDMFGVCKSAIHLIVNHKRWTHI